MLCTFTKDIKSGDIYFDCDDDGEILRAFLESELQEDLTYTEYVLAKCNTSKISSFEISGNSYNLLINNDIFEIENLFNNTEILTGNRIFLTQTLEKWVRMLSQK